jgi:putative Mn2+ efflux pump MntP
MTGAIGLLALGVAIGANNLAVSLALGALGQWERRWRIVSVFALFEFSMPLIGILIGRRVAESLALGLGWLAPVLLIGFGLWAGYEALRPGRDEERLAARVASLKGLVLLSASLSLDNLMIGLSLGLSGYSPLTVSATICAFSVVFALFGLRAGRSLRRQARIRAELGAAGLLVGVGVALWAGVI